MACVLPLRCFLFLLPNFNHAIIMQLFSYLDEREVLQQEYSPPPILPSPHFHWVVNWCFLKMHGVSSTYNKRNNWCYPTCKMHGIGSEFPGYDKYFFKNNHCLY